MRRPPAHKRARVVTSSLVVGIVAGLVGLGLVASQATTAANELSGQSPNQVLTTSLVAATAHGSFHVTERASALGALNVTEVGDVGVNEGRETLAGGPIGSATLMWFPGAIYLQGNAKFLGEALELSSADSSRLADQWIAFRPGDAGYSQVSGISPFSTVIKDLRPSGQLTLGSQAIVDGTNVISVSGLGPAASGEPRVVSHEVLDVSTSSPFLPVQEVVRETVGGVFGEAITLGFSSWGERLSLVAPTDPVPSSSIPSLNPAQGGGSSGSGQPFNIEDA